MIFEMMGMLQFYWRSISLQIRSQATFRTSLAMDIISTSFYGFTEIVGLLLIVNELGNISGWTVWELAFLMAMAELSFGCMDMLFSGFDPDYFAPAVRKGELDMMLLRPYPLFLQIMGSRFVLRRFGRIFTGVFTLLITIWNLQVTWTAGDALYLVLILFSQICLFGSFFIFGSTLTFWTIERIEAINIITYGGREVMTYPMEIFPGWLRKIFIYFLPFLFMNYSPAIFLLRKVDILGLPQYSHWLAPFISTAFLISAILFWNFGKKHYQSSGS